MKHTTITHKAITKLEATKNNKALQAAKNKSRIPFTEKQSLQIILNNIMQELEVQKANNGGRMPYGATISEIVFAKQKILPCCLSIL